MKRTGSALAGILVSGTLLFAFAGCAGGEGAEPGTPTEARASGERNPPTTAAAEIPLKPQETCPVMGGKIDKHVFTDHRGKRVYFCCARCVPEFKMNPELYLKVLKDRGEKVEDVLE
jgi:YHS domain-containing protein